MNYYLDAVFYSISPLVVPGIIWLVGFAFGNATITTIGRRLGKWMVAFIGGFIIYVTFIDLASWLFNADARLFFTVTVGFAYPLLLIGLARRNVISFK